MARTYSDRKRRNLRLAGAAAAGIAAMSGGTLALAIGIPGSHSTASELVLRSAAALDQYSFAYDGILGTSMDLTVHAPRQQDALACEAAVLCEIERLRAILSTYDPLSEISRVRAGATIHSEELGSLLESYKLWNARSAGAVDVNVAEIIKLWKLAARQDALPPVDSIRAALDAPMALNVDALGKGFIIDRAVEVAMKYAPAGVLNIGGDIRVWGESDWLTGIADPRDPAENAPLIAQLRLRNAAVATSGGYARFFKINGQRYPHIIDPRTGFPVKQITSATVIADDCMTANAISTAASVMGGFDGSELAEDFGRGHLLLTGTNDIWRGGAIAMADAAPASSAGAATTKPVAENVAAAGHWPKDFAVTIKIALKSFDAAGPGVAARGPATAPAPEAIQASAGPRRGGARPAKRPYVAVWIQDSAGQVVRTLTLWGNQPKWMRELSYWFQAANGDPKALETVSRATRPPGEYALKWDGLDNAGKPLPRGQYTVVVEVNREHGRHVKQTAMIACDDKEASVELAQTAESDASSIEYGPRGTETAAASGAR